MAFGLSLRHNITWRSLVHFRKVVPISHVKRQSHYNILSAAVLLNRVLVPTANILSFQYIKCICNITEVFLAIGRSPEASF